MKFKPGDIVIDIAKERTMEVLGYAFTNTDVLTGHKTDYWNCCFANDVFTLPEHDLVLERIYNSRLYAALQESDDEV